MWHLLLLLFASMFVLTSSGDGKPLSTSTHGCVMPDEVSCPGSAATTLDIQHINADMVGIKKDKKGKVRKVLMSWTPKAGCTQAVLMFYDYMGFEEGVDFEGWPHDFRKFYYQRCGNGSPCMYSDPTWYRFKVVRNPYDRAVSSYLHVMKTHIIEVKYFLAAVPGLKAKWDMSFNDFLTYVENTEKSPLDMGGMHDGSHIRKQSYDFEFYAWLEGKPIFNRIVKLESLLEDIALVNSEAGTNFKGNFTSHHYAKRHEEDFYVGNSSYKELRKEIPQNYGLFYDANTKERVYRLYFADVLAYNYSFPF